MFCCQGGLSFFSCTYQSYTLIILCKDINLKISVILVRHTCILLEHNKFVHKDNRALSEIKMIKWSLICSLREFCFSYREVSMVRFVLWCTSVFKFMYFSSLVLNTIHWYTSTLLYSIYWILTRTPWHWKRDLCWNYWGHQQ